MAFDFPSSPFVGQTYAPVPGILYTWNGYAWAAQTSSTGMTTRIVPITASGTYTPSAGLVSAIIECVGGGGGGGGVTGIAAVISGGGGGGSGGYSRKALTAAQIGSSLNVVVGAAGVGASGADGTAGGDTYVGASYAASLCGAKGGGGGGRRASGTAATAGLGGAAGIGDIASAGAPGLGFVDGDSATNAFGLNAGGSSVFGGGGPGGPAPSSGSYPGNNASNYGSGGGGATFYNSGSAAGGNGSAGIVVITEFIAVTATVAPGFPVQIARVDVSSAVAAVSFTSGIDATYDEYEFHVYGFKPTVDAFLLMRFSQDGGATFKSGATDYHYVYTGFGANNAAQNFGGVTSSLFLGSARVFAGAGFGGVCRGSLYQPSSTTMRKYIHWAASSTGTVTSWAATGGGNYVTDTNAINAIQFLTDTGNILAGTFVLYGIKK